MLAKSEEHWFEELQVSAPRRTCQPVSDGECYLRNVADIEFV